MQSAPPYRRDVLRKAPRLAALRRELWQSSPIAASLYPLYGSSWGRVSQTNILLGPCRPPSNVVASKGDREIAGGVKAHAGWIGWVNIRVCFGQYFGIQLPKALVPAEYRRIYG